MSNTIKATLPPESVSNGRNYWGDKPVIQTIHAVVIHARQMRTAVTVRVHGTNARNYCSVWVDDHLTHRYYAGHGWAGGFGYHRPSSALQVALKSAGITLSKDIDGCGAAAMRDAVIAICHALGHRNVYLVEN